MNWYTTGADASKAVDAEIEQQEQNRKPNRLWIPAGEEKTIVFVDDSGFSFHEHQLKLNESWRNWFTCLRNTGKPCPLCTSGYGRYLATMYTVIDVDGYTDNQGNEKTKLPMLLVAKPQTAKILERKKKARGGSLAGAKFTVFRATQKDAGCGNDFEYVETIDPGTLVKDIKPFDYKELFKPMTEEQMKLILSGKQSNQSAAPNTGGESTGFTAEDIPF